MVSQPDTTSSSLSRRGASSVIGGSSSSRPTAASTVVAAPHSSSLSRAKRYNRSHTGGGGRASYIPDNDFPVFSQSGDVEIVIRAGPVEKRYLLHRDTLARCSGFFEASTSEPWSKARPVRATLPSGNELTKIGEDGIPTPSASALDGDVGGGGGGHAADIWSYPGRNKMWRYELDMGDDEDDIPMLVQKDSGSTNGRAPPPPPPMTTTSSLFGPGESRSRHAKPGHASSRSVSGGSDFSRSVSNLGLGSSSRRHHHHHHHHTLSQQQQQEQEQPRLSRAERDLLRDYDNLFRTMYNYSPLLDGVNVADAYVQCKSLLSLADQYDSLAVVGPRVDHHLLQFQSRLWKQIAKYPVSYLRLGYLAHSKVIFQEALIHVVGQWPSGERSLRAALPDSVLDMIEDKVDELEEAVSRVEGRLFRLNLTTPRGDPVHPSTSYLDWLAVSLFRQWIADNTSPQPPPTSSSRPDPATRSRQPAAPPPVVPPLSAVGRAYRTLGSENAASYLDHDDCKRFLKLTPHLYSRDNLRRFEGRIHELKAMARDLVRPLMGSGLELDLAGSSRAADSVAYLTCTSISNRDLPWT
ncbi:hypothetical protein GMORB2_2053 [Geosmithia morbida]|uniref:BTB domain-containing protein n=1 Tax=Geosmithia morbida TaxID=1094350 RepID=A0A9P4YTA0_9HYPO|nr:uncharacterized protein GMORB2_2053 [Geosmithia morbida]KAF4121645.1 hypothetical protein GMORB2_2053 [Geosmithia morbida]